MSKTICTFLLHVLPQLNSFANRVTWPYSTTAQTIKDSHETKKKKGWKLITRKRATSNNVTSDWGQGSKNMRLHFFNSAVIANLKMDYWLEPTKPRPILLTGSRSANFPRARRLFFYLKQYLNLLHQTIPCKETYFCYWYFRSSKASFQNTQWCQLFSAQEADAVKWMKLRKSKDWTGEQRL